MPSKVGGWLAGEDTHQKNICRQDGPKDHQHARPTAGWHFPVSLGVGGLPTSSGLYFCLRENCNRKEGRNFRRWFLSRCEAVRVRSLCHTFNEKEKEKSRIYIFWRQMCDFQMDCFPA